jgi:hypothetical protein
VSVKHLRTRKVGVRDSQGVWCTSTVPLILSAPPAQIINIKCDVVCLMFVCSRAACEAAIKSATWRAERRGDDPLPGGQNCASVGSQSSRANSVESDGPIPCALPRSAEGKRGGGQLTGPLRYA